MLESVSGAPVKNLNGAAARTELRGRGGGMAAVPAHDQLSKRNQRGICSGGANDVKPAGGIFFGIGIGIGSGKAGIISLPP